METWKGIKNIITYLQNDEPSDPEIGDVWVRPGEYEKRIWVSNFWKCQVTQNGWGPGSDYGFIAGGYDGSNDLSTIDRIQFPFNSAAY